MNNHLKRIYKLIDEDNYSEALKIVNNIIEKRALLHPQIYLLKAKLIEITNDDKYSLKDIEENYKKAISIDKNYIDAIIEYADYCFDIADNWQEANKLYVQADKLNIEQKKEIERGLYECEKEFNLSIPVGTRKEEQFKNTFIIETYKNIETKPKENLEATLTETTNYIIQ